MKKFLTRSEFSKLTGIGMRALRHWDQIGLFNPEKRDEKTNYRYYSINQIISVKFILVLQKLGIPLKEINTIINKKNPESIGILMEKQKTLVRKELKKLKTVYSIVHTRLELINYGIKADTSKISVIDMPEFKIKLGPSNDFKNADRFYEPLINFCNKAEKLKIDLGFPIGAYHTSIESFFSNPNTPEHFFSLNLVKSKKRQTNKYLVGYTRGYYGELNDLAERMKKYAIKNSISLSGPVYTLYLHDEICIQNSSEYLTQVCIAINKS